MMKSNQEIVRDVFVIIGRFRGVLGDMGAALDQLEDNMGHLQKHNMRGGMVVAEGDMQEAWNKFGNAFLDIERLNEKLEVVEINGELPATATAE